MKPVIVLQIIKYILGNAAVREMLYAAAAKTKTPLDNYALDFMYSMLDKDYDNV
jgi:hypothetical protein